MNSNSNNLVSVETICNFTAIKKVSTQLKSQNSVIFVFLLNYVYLIFSRQSICLIKTYIQVHLNKLECRGKVNFFQ